MNLIEKSIEKLTPSEAIFECTTEKNYYNKTTVILRKMTVPRVPDIKNSIDRLVIKHYAEHFNNDLKCFTVDRDHIIDSCKGDIKNHMLKFLERHMKQKYPLETKLGMFYHRQVFNHEVPAFDNAFISTYNYWKEKSDAQNTLKLLEYLFIKHRGDFPEKRPKKKRMKRRRLI